MKRLITYFSTALLGLSVGGYANDYVISDNVYVSHDQGEKIEVLENRSAPLPEEAHKAVMITDPVHSNNTVVLRAEEQVKQARKQALIAEENLYKPSKLKFRTLNLKGRIAKPRVKFERTSLPTGRVDETYNSNFFKKVFDVKDDLDF
jgi:hypothetical protein